MFMEDIDIIQQTKFVISEALAIEKEARASEHNIIALKALDSLRNTFEFCCRILEKSEANLAMKIELAKLQNKEDEKEEDEEYNKRLNERLNIEELKFLSRVNNKLFNDSDPRAKEDIIVLDGKILKCYDNMYNVSQFDYGK